RRVQGLGLAGDQGAGRRGQERERRRADRLEDGDEPEARPRRWREAGEEPGRPARVGGGIEADEEAAWPVEARLHDERHALRPTDDAAAHAAEDESAPESVTARADDDRPDAPAPGLAEDGVDGSPVDDGHLRRWPARAEECLRAPRLAPDG